MIELKVNGVAQRIDADPTTPLLWIIRENLDLIGTKFGCGIAQCGACTVHVDGQAVRSCTTPLSAVAGRSVTTIEGLASDGAPHAVQQAWIDEQVPQCGYCQSGQIMAAAALLAEKPDARRRGDRHGHARQYLPLWNLLARPPRHQTGRQEQRAGGDRVSLGKWTRRGFITAGIVTGGALLVGVAIRPGHRAPKVRALVADDEEALLTVWLKIAPNNRTTAIVPHAEMGQGAHSTLAQMLADELDADWRLVDVLEAPAHEEYANYSLGKGFLLGEADIPRALVGTVDGAFLQLTQALDLQITGGSTSIRTTGRHAMRVAGAAAREMLAQAAAQAWGVPVRELTLQDSHVAHAASSRRGSYAEFATAAAAITPSAKPKLKTAEQFRLIGKSVPRLDIPAKVDGSAAFGIDARVPGAQVATVLGSPVFQGRVAAIDETAALALPGVRRVVDLDDAVAVVADGYWQAKQGLSALRIDWDNGGRDQIDQEAIFAQFSRDSRSRKRTVPKSMSRPAMSTRRLPVQSNEFPPSTACPIWRTRQWNP